MIHEQNVQVLIPGIFYNMVDYYLKLWEPQINIMDFLFFSNILAPSFSHTLYIIE